MLRITANRILLYGIVTATEVVALPLIARFRGRGLLGCVVALYIMQSAMLNVSQ